MQFLTPGAFLNTEGSLCKKQSTSMKAAKIVTTLLLNLALFSPCLFAAASTDTPIMMMGGPIHHDYTHFADVERHCQSVLSSGAELKDGADSDRRLMYQLSFMDGDWSQDAGHAPLLPFHGSYADPAVAGPTPDPVLLEAVPLASFRVTDMETETEKVPRRGARAAFNVSGLLTFTIARNRSCNWPHVEMKSSPEFELRPGIAKLHVAFQGVYTETRSPGSGDDGGGGERVLCMVGDAVLPVRGSNSTDPWDWATNRGGGSNLEPPPVVSVGNILLVLRYPKTPTLTTRAVHGEMTSTNAKSDGAYFDPVRLVSHLSVGYDGSGYQFRQDVTELDVAGSCSKGPPIHDHEGDATEHLNSGDSLCAFLHQASYDSRSQLMEVAVPNWNCKGTDEFCSRVGPFVTSRSAVDDMAFAGSAIAVTTGFQCKPLGSTDGPASAPATARVAAVFRLVPPWEHQPTAAKRTGMSNTTLSAEGVWIPSTGRVCMLGCLGAGKEACHYRVTLSVVTTLSVTRRAIIAGEITAMDGTSHPPLLFQQRVNPWIGGYRPFQPRMSYAYTKVKQAQELRRLRASETTRFRDSFVAKSVLSYPSTEGAASDDMASLANLADELDLRFECAVKPPFVQQWIEGQYFGLQILSIGTMVGRNSSHQSQSMRIELLSSRVHVHGVQKQQVLNVSAELVASGNCLGPSPVMSLEGVYNEGDGRMYLIGCRKVHTPRRALPTSRDLEDGMDCSIVVTVEYPPKTTRWLISRAAKVVVASTRDGDDPLYFNRTELRTQPVVYRDQRQHQLTEPIVEGLLCVTMLSATIAATTSQLRYLKSHADVAPYISLAMLGVQALGYSLTLVTDAKMLPAWPSQSYRPDAGHLGWSILDCSVKALTLAALLVTAQLAQKVWRSRARARVRAPLEPGRVPGDTAVLLYTVGVHLGTVFVVVAVDWLSTYGTSPSLPVRVVYSQAHWTPSSPAHMYMRSGAVMAERYAGVVKEWFLLPQVIGNAVWRVNCRPLAAEYYAGVTAVWLLPRVYGYLRPPIVNMYAPVAYRNVVGFYYKAGTVVVPVVGVLLAMVVYVQQRWNDRIVGWATRTEKNKLHHVY